MTSAVKTNENTPSHMKDMTLENIARACGGIYNGDNSFLSREITGVEKDSRQIYEGCLYLPFAGKNVDGHDFIHQAYEKGALCCLSERKLENPAGPYILVDSVGEALKKIAEYYRMRMNIPLIGVTGSVGKTSTKEMIASVLSQKYNVLKTDGNYNNEIGMPLTILKIRKEHEVAVVEMGISDFGEMKRLSKVARPDICVITNIGTCHLERLGDRDGVLKAKSEIFEYMRDDGTVILNGDDDRLATIKDVCGIKPVFYGINTDRTAKAIILDSLGIDGTRVRMEYDGESFDTVVPVPGEHMVYNALAALCAGKALGLTVSQIDSGIRSAHAVGGRGHVIKTKGMTVFDDCYNANPMSVKAAIRVLSGCAGRKVAILGDMLELGDKAEALHSETGEFAALSGIDLIICEGTLSKSTADAAARVSNGRGRVYYFENLPHLMEALPGLLREGDAVLVKASNGMNFKSVLDFILAM